MGYVPYKLLNRSELSYIESSLKKACTSWVTAWFGDQQVCDVTCHRAAEFDKESLQPDIPWLALGAANEAWAAVATPAAELAALGGALLSGGEAENMLEQAKKSDLVQELSVSALAELLAGIVSVSDAPAAAATRHAKDLGAATWKAGSGAVAAVVDCVGVRLVLALNQLQVATLLNGIGGNTSKRPVLASTTAGISNGRLQLQALVGEAQLELELLQTIVVGDVIKLDTRVDQPLHVINEDGIRLCGAYLGAQHGRKSIQLTK